MQARDFCFWLQGLMEVGKITELDATQVAQIKQHLGLVFQHDPTMAHEAITTPEKPAHVPFFRPAEQARATADGRKILYC